MIFKWLRKFKVVEKTVIRCGSCFLEANRYMQIRFQPIGEKPSNDKIIIPICDDCYEEVYERYNPQRLPAPVQVGIFEQTD
jgi:hypothetical protein